MKNFLKAEGPAENSAVKEFYGTAQEFAQVLSANNQHVVHDSVRVVGDTVQTNTNGSKYILFEFWNHRTRVDHIFINTGRSVNAGDPITELMFGAFEKEQGLVALGYKTKEPTKDRITLYEL